MLSLIRVLLGIFMIMMGINKFYPYLEPMNFSPAANNLVEALAMTGYIFPMIAVFEIVTGLLLLNKKTAALGTLVLLPMSFNYFMFHLVLDPSSMTFALLVFSLNLLYIWHYFKYYRSVFARMMNEHIVFKSNNKEQLKGSMI